MTVRRLERVSPDASASSFLLSSVARERDGHLNAWARAAKDAFDRYCALVERNPSATVILTVSVE